MKKFPFLLASLLLLASCSKNEPQEESFTPSTTPPPVVSENKNTPSTPSVPVVESTGIQFTSTTAKGEPISSAIFQDYDLTVVNVWATWCGPCVNEMPDLEELYHMLPENINFITVCEDYSRSEATANAILDSIGASFQTIVANQEVSNTLLSGLLAFPTTLFIDREGNFVGSPLQGAPSGNVANVYFSRIQQVYESLDLDTVEPPVSEEEDPYVNYERENSFLPALADDADEN